MSGEKDTLVEMINADIPRDMARLKKADLKNLSITGELSGTILSYIRDLALELKGVRDWASESVLRLSDDVDGIEMRVDSLEVGETQILPEDAEKFVKIIAAAKWMAEELLKHGQTNEGVEKLKEIISLADECQAIIDDGVLSDDDEDEEEGDEDEDEDDEETH